MERLVDSATTHPGLAVVQAVALNVLPLLGVVLLGWNSFDILLLYWVENIVVGAFAIITIALRGSLVKALFFSVHFGGFCFVHGIFLVQLFGPPALDGDLLAALQGIASSWMMWLAVLALVIMQGYEQLQAWQAANNAPPVPEAKRISQLMAAPYQRIVVLHITLIGSGLLLDQFGRPLLGLVLLVLLKMAFDVYRLRKQGREPEGAEPVDASPR